MLPAISDLIDEVIVCLPLISQITPLRFPFQQRRHELSRCWNFSAFGEFRGEPYSPEGRDCAEAPAPGRGRPLWQVPQFTVGFGLFRFGMFLRCVPLMV